jgi:hypothetical protein
MDLSEKYAKAVAALQAIAKFGHVDSCTSHAPVHECGCYEKDEKQLARAVLDELDEGL